MQGWGHLKLHRKRRLGCPWGQAPHLSRVEKDREQVKADGGKPETKGKKSRKGQPMEQSRDAIMWACGTEGVLSSPSTA